MPSAVGYVKLAAIRDVVACSFGVTTVVPVPLGVMLILALLVTRQKSSCH